MGKELEAERRGRTQGVVFAAAWIAKYHGYETIAKELLDVWGTDLADAKEKGCDEQDIAALKEAGVW